MNFEVRRFPALDSTNRYLLTEARAGAPEGVVAVADHQTAGRGRRGRTWVAAPGSALLCSVLLRPDLEPGRRQLVTMAAGLAAADAVEAVAGFAPELKWPNDLVVGERKLAGLLAESDSTASPSRPAPVVVGIGINVAPDPRLPDEVAARATSCREVAGRAVEVDALLDALLDRLGERYEAGLGPATVTDYRRRLATIGRAVRVERPDGEVVGRAVDVGPAGELLVEVGAGCVVDVHVGDVVHLRPAR